MKLVDRDDILRIRESFPPNRKVLGDADGRRRAVVWGFPVYGFPPAYRLYNLAKQSGDGSWLSSHLRQEVLPVGIISTLLLSCLGIVKTIYWQLLSGERLKFATAQWEREASGTRIRGSSSTEIASKNGSLDDINLVRRRTSSVCLSRSSRQSARFGTRSTIRRKNRGEIDCINSACSVYIIHLSCLNIGGDGEGASSVRRCSLIILRGGER